MKHRLDRSATVLAAAILLAYASVSDAQETNRGSAPRGDRAATIAQAPATAQAVRDLRLSELIGMDVRNPKGENLGDVTDVVVDVENGRVAYAVVGIGGFLGIGEKLSVFQLSAFKMTQASTGAAPAGTRPMDNDGVQGDRGSIGPDRTSSSAGSATDRAAATANSMLSGRGTGGMHLTLDADPQRLKRAPNFDARPWPDWNDARFRGEVDRAAGANPSAKVGRMLRGSQLLDADIRDPASKNVGEVEDVVIDVRTGAVRYAVIDFDQAWTPDDKLVAVPMKALRPMGEKGELVFGGDRSQLERAPSFDNGKWPDLNGGSFRAVIDRYLSSWRAESPGGRAPTPGNGMTGATGTGGTTGTTGSTGTTGTSGATGR